jgi:DNA-binding PadR family transcriptional regulator
MSMSEDCRPEPPDCCDMRGMLAFQILWLLSKRSMNGQELSNELGARRGAKPTPGTIYPALKELREKDLVTMERKGRATIYTLTAEGDAGLEKACRYFCSAFGDIFQAFSETRTRSER